MADGVACAPTEEDLPGDDDAEATLRGVEHRGALPRDRVARHLVGGSTEGVQDPAERHVLAERHTANLLVPRDLLARGVERDLRVVEAVRHRRPR